MEEAKRRSQELRNEQAKINQLLAAMNQRLCDLIEAARNLGQERQLKYANALMVQFNKRTRGYVAALAAIGDTFEEILSDAGKSTGRQEGDVV